MELTLSVSGKQAAFFAFLVLLFCSVGFVVANGQVLHFSYPYSQPLPNPGHGGDTVWVDVPGQGEMALQDAINAGLFPGPISCPTGFTAVASSGVSLGCIQNQAQAAKECRAAVMDCFNSYGGRLPSFNEAYTGMKYSLGLDITAITTQHFLDGGLDGGDWDNYCFGIKYDHIGGGNWDLAAVADAGEQEQRPYRCFIPALGETTGSGLPACLEGQTLKFSSGSWTCADASTGFSRAVFGTVDNVGNVVKGTGFSAVYTLTNPDYCDVTFDTPFSSPPTVVATVTDDTIATTKAPREVNLRNVTANGFRFEPRAYNGATSYERAFSFIAVGE